MAETAFTDEKTWHKYGFMLAINNKSIRKLYERYKSEHNIGYTIALTDRQRQEFEEAVMKPLCKRFKVLYHRDFVYPGTDWDRQLFTELVNALDVDSIKKKGSELN